jgi:outer membrane receptor protein involved in Fe transport
MIFYRSDTNAEFVVANPAGEPCCRRQLRPQNESDKKEFTILVYKISPMFQNVFPIWVRSAGTRRMRALFLPVLTAFLWAGICGGSSARAQENEAAGSIRGTIKDEDFGDPLENARVTVQELNRSVTTRDSGSFVMENVPPGTYTVSISKTGYARKVRSQVLVRAGQLSDLEEVLSGELYEMEEMVVQAEDLLGGTEAGLIELRQDSASLIDAIGSDLLSKAGASDAADAVKLVVGVTVSEDKSAVVRGLGDRYTVTTLNNARIPSPNPTKRAVELDMFPTSIIESINVSKTFMPDMQGEATGGAVNIVTKTIPDEPILEVSTGVGYDTQATGNSKFRTYKGAGEPLAVDLDGSRDIPKGAYASQLATAGDPFRISAQTRSFDSVMGTSTETPEPNQSYSLALGDKFRINEEQAFGVLFSLSHKQDFDFVEGGKRIVRTPQPGGTHSTTPDNQFDYDEGKQETSMNSALSLGYQVAKDHQVQLNLLYNAVAEDSAILNQDAGANDGIADTDQAMRHRARMLVSAQLRGEHRIEPLNNTQVNWQFASNFARQYDPDTRFFEENTQQAGPPVGAIRNIDTAPGSEPQRIWQEVIDISQQGSLDIKVPFKFWTETEGYLKMGVFAEELKRDFDIERYHYVAGGPEAVSSFNDFFSGNGVPGNLLLSDIFFNPNFNTVGLNPATNQLGWILENNNVNVVNYDGEQRIQALYLMAEVPLMENFKVAGGGRLETTEIGIEVGPPRGFADVTGDGIPEDFVTVFRRQSGTAIVNSIDIPIDEANTQLEEQFIHPAFGMTYEPLKNLFFRGNYAKTTARPTFRELAPTLDMNIEDNDGFFGNPQLKMAEADNWDFRAEWFPRPRTMLSTSVFYKSIKNPIETVIAGSSGGSLYTKENFPKGEVRGFEVEARQGLDVFHETLSPFAIGANFAWIESRATVPDYLRQDLVAGNAFDPDRPLTGTPAYLANASFTYDNPETKTSVGVFYTLQGETLLAGGGMDANGPVASRVALPWASLNFSITQGFAEYWSISFKARNVLNPEIEVVERLPDDDDVRYKSYTKGVDLTLGVKYSW